MQNHSKKNSIHHSFDIDLAAIYGVHEAILIHHFQHWISINIRRKQNFKDGRTWTYQTIEQIADYFPYWTLEQVREAVERLCTGQNRKSKKAEKEFNPVLVKGNFNKKKFDRTTWFAFVNEEEFLNIFYDRGNPQKEEGVSPTPKRDIPRPIPDSKTDSKTDSSSSSPPTKEEEEEIDRRIRERPKDAPPIKAMKKYRAALHKEILSESKDKETLNQTIHKRRLLVEGWDGKKFNGMHVVAGKDYVEFCLGDRGRIVRYDVSEEEWREKTGW